MNKDVIVKIIKRHGEEGAEEIERYIDVKATITQDGLELAQLVCYLSSDELLGYFLDEDYNGYWIEFEEMEKDTQGKILELEYWAGILEDEKKNIDYINKSSVSGEVDYIIHAIEQSDKDMVTIKDNVEFTLGVNGKKETLSPIAMKVNDDNLAVECVLTADGTDTLSYITYERNKEYNWRERILLDYIYDSIKTLCES